jgi:CxxC motif-containing protein
MKKTMICINCPRGCTLEVSNENGEIQVTGNSCPRGEAFGRQEMICPMRTISSTVRTIFPEVPVLPCRVSQEIPKEKISDVMHAINQAVIRTRIGSGDVIIKDVEHTGADVIATSNILKEEDTYGV